MINPIMCLSIPLDKNSCPPGYLFNNSSRSRDKKLPYLVKCISPNVEKQSLDNTPGLVLRLKPDLKTIQALHL